MDGILHFLIITCIIWTEQKQVYIYLLIYYYNIFLKLSFEYLYI